MTTDNKMPKNKRSSTVERRKFILNELNTAGQVLVQTLSREFDVSEVTIRNDLEQLERKKMLIRARGGALKVDNGVGIDHHISEKDKLHTEEKARIGRKAASLVNEFDTVIIDSGTTTMEVAKNLGNLKEITVITNALNIASQLIHHPGFHLIIPGGYLRKNSLSLMGPLAEKNFQNLYVDKVFLGVDGFDTRHGIYTPNIDEAALNEIMIRNAREVILVTDSSKFARKSLAYICGIDRLHKVVTDGGISEEDKKRLEDAGIEVIIA
jgi:DeoR family transcriptional regulator, aga operon transcriptional repressor